MLIWVSALHCEAKPVIDFYRLKKSHDESAFDLYRGDDMLCVVSGIGKIASAAATAWVAASHSQRAPLAWINLGSAGAAEREIGDAFLLNQIIDADSGQRFYPAAGLAACFAGACCISLSQASEQYHERCLFDQEASGFIQAALRFSTAELTQSIKIVSDNHLQKTGRQRQQVSDLIAGHIETIDRQATNLIDLKREVELLNFNPDSWQRLIETAHFTQTQKNRLRVIWRYLQNRDFDESQLMQTVSQQASAEKIIAALERIGFADSESL